MHSESITTSPFIVQEDTILLDDGKLENLEIIVSSGVKLQYLLLPSEASHNTRTFHVHAHATFIGAGVYHHADMVQKLSVIINGNNISADLKLLTLLRDHARISVDGIGRVEKGSENIHLRVDQTNILLGKDIAIQGRPVLEIETDSIEGGHSNRTHRISGEALFYLQSHGIDASTAEGLLLSAEIRRHVGVLGEQGETIIEQLQATIVQK